jgi:hypothetical protein
MQLLDHVSLTLTYLFSFSSHLSKDILSPHKSLRLLLHVVEKLAWFRLSWIKGISRCSGRRARTMQRFAMRNRPLRPSRLLTHWPSLPNYKSSRWARTSALVVTHVIQDVVADSFELVTSPPVTVREIFAIYFCTQESVQVGKMGTGYLVYAIASLKDGSSGDA